MADNLQATPRNELLGLLSDAMYGGLDWMKSPERTQQMQGLAGLLESTGIPQTTQRLAYGEPLTNIGRANVPLLKPETAEAIMNVAPLAPVAGRLASRAIRATEGMPVGMGIKPINLNKGIYKPELTMEEMLKVKDIPTVERVRKSIDLVGEKEFEKMVNAQYKKYKPSDQDQEAMLVESVTLDILGRAQRSPYPQQAALDLAQQRAALPVSEGGLGLPANNTPEMRAKAMGFKESGYSGTSKDFINYDPSKSSGAGSGSREGPLGAWLTDDPRVASEFANWSSRGQGGDVVYPLMIRGYNPYQPSAYSEIKDILDANTQFSRPPYRMMQDKINYENAIRDLEAKGDYVALRNTLTDAIDNPITQFLVTDPTRLRSRFAAFDPFRKDVATATAMGVALPDLLAAEPTPQPQSSGLLYPFP